MSALPGADALTRWRFDLEVAMSMPWFWIWIVVAAILYIGEMLTTGFFLLPFAIGATASLISAIFNAPLWLQWVLFVVVSLLALVATRPMARRIAARGGNARSGVDRLIGMDGQVLDQRSPDGTYRARIAREIWNVSTEDGSELSPGMTVHVIRVEGVRLIVQMLPEQP